MRENQRRQFAHSACASYTRCKDQCNGRGHLLPVRQFFFELLAAGFREGVKLGAAIIFGGAPFRADPFLAFQAIERGIERALLDLQDVARDLLDALGDAPAVHRFERESFQDQQIERALQNFDGPAPCSLP